MAQAGKTVFLRELIPTDSFCQPRGPVCRMAAMKLPIKTRIVVREDW